MTNKLRRIINLLKGRVQPEGLQSKQMPSQLKFQRSTFRGLRDPVKSASDLCSDRVTSWQNCAELLRLYRRATPCVTDIGVTYRPVQLASRYETQISSSKHVGDTIILAGILVTVRYALDKNSSSRVPVDDAEGFQILKHIEVDLHSSKFDRLYLVVHISTS
jgi:hypothetical protein